MKARLLMVAVAAAAAVALAASGTASATTTTPAAVLGSGSDVMFHVQSALDTLYNQSPGCTTIAPSGTQPLDFSCVPQTGDVTTEDYAHDRITEAFPIGGSAGVSQLCTQGSVGVATINYARQTTAPSSSVCTGLNYVAYGRDGITWLTFPTVTGSHTAGITNLSQAQLQGIYVNCTITNWSQVGGPNAPIVKYTVLPQYGTRKAFDAFLGGSSSSCAGTKLMDQTKLSDIVAADRPNAIAPVSVGSWTERYKASPQGSALHSIDGVAPTLVNIGNASFPYSRFLYDVYCAGDPTHSNQCGTAQPASAATVRYVGANGWLCTASKHAADPTTGLGYRTEIVKTINKFGFAALPLGATGGGTAFTDYCRQFTT